MPNIWNNDTKEVLNMKMDMIKKQPQEFRKWLYSVELPKGKIFTNEDEYNKAKEAGGVCSPADVGKVKEPEPEIIPEPEPEPEILELEIKPKKAGRPKKDK